MALFAISDLHLSLGLDKPMDIFGPHWKDHAGRLQARWTDTVGEDDTVVVPGDISWAMRMADALPDLAFLDALPGLKILGRGNHDYWWGTLGSMERQMAAAGFRTLRFLRNNAHVLPDGTCLCGTRGWLLPDDPAFGESDGSIHLREINRLRLSLASRPDPARRTVAALHFPPCGRDGGETEYTRLLEEGGVDICVYGHLHGDGISKGPSGRIRGVLYHNASADRIGFKPLRL